MLDPKLLSYFVEVADTGSFSQAAARLNVTQSWLSRQVATLEQQIGFKLFDRTSRTVVLTRQGQEMLGRAQTAVDHVRGVQALATKLGRKESTLSIGVPTYALTAEERLTLLDNYLARYSKVRIDTRIDSFRQLEAALVQGELDLMFAIAVPRLLADPQTDVAIVAHGGVDIIFAQGDAFEAQDSISFDQLGGRPVSAFSRRSNAELFALVFGAAIEAKCEIAEFSDYSFYRNLAEQGAVTLMPRWQPIPMPGLRRLPLTGYDGSIDLACVRMAAHSHPALERFWALAQEMAATKA